MTTKAEKDYQCRFCGDPIRQGQIYYVIKAKSRVNPDNEGFATWRVHALCEKYAFDYYHSNDAYIIGHYMDPDAFKAHLWDKIK